MKEDGAVSRLAVVRDVPDAATPDTMETSAGESEPVRVLVVGDDPNMVDLLGTTLRFGGYQVRTAGPGNEAVSVAEQWKPDLMARDGFQVTQFQHGTRLSTPAIFLTPSDQLHSQLPGLTVGGGDHLPKPFSPEELLARVRSVLRRSQVDRQVHDGIMRFADLLLEEETFQVRRAGRPLHLTPTEFQLLRYLMRNQEKVLSSVQILDHVWPYDYAGDPKVVQIYMSKVRRKVDYTRPHLIHTVRGRGYSLCLPHE